MAVLGQLGTGPAEVAPACRVLAADNIRAAAEDSLRRLGRDYIDLYYAHRDDESRLPAGRL
ncbi:MAG TPA: aldo/keto reductase [Pseudonocardiaceae bacterium]|nr:aldo/keto reductase [Pseudonocardiaceae bacterium]